MTNPEQQRARLTPAQVISSARKAMAADPQMSADVKALYQKAIEHAQVAQLMQEAAARKAQQQNGKNPSGGT